MTPYCCLVWLIKGKLWNIYVLHNITFVYDWSVLPNCKFYYSRKPDYKTNCHLLKAIPIQLQLTIDCDERVYTNYTYAFNRFFTILGLTLFWRIVARRRKIQLSVQYYDNQNIDYSRNCLVQATIECCSFLLQVED